MQNVWRASTAREGHMATRLTGKIALVTGGGSGIGRAIALRFAVEGATVIALDVDEAAAMQTATQAAQDGAEIVALPADVSDAEEVREALEAVAGRWGHLDVLCN